MKRLYSRKFKEQASGYKVYTYKIEVNVDSFVKDSIVDFETFIKDSYVDITSAEIKVEADKTVVDNFDLGYVENIDWNIKEFMDETETNSVMLKNNNGESAIRFTSIYLGDQSDHYSLLYQSDSIHSTDIPPKIPVGITMTVMIDKKGFNIRGKGTLVIIGSQLNTLISMAIDNRNEFSTSTEVV